MNFAYIQGQEAEALAYYEKRLQQTRDEREQEELKAVIEHLKKAVAKTGERVPDAPMRSLALSCSSVSRTE